VIVLKQDIMRKGIAVLLGIVRMLIRILFFWTAMKKIILVSVMDVPKMMEFSIVMI